MRGIDPRTSRMRSERSTIWATSPYPLSFELASEQNPWYISFRFVTSCQFLPTISKHQIELSKPQKVLKTRGIDPRTSRMRSERSTISATFLYSSSFELASEQTSWNISCRFVTSCQFFPFVSQNKVEWSKPRKCFGDAGHRSPYLSHAKRALYHLSYIPVLLSFELASEQNQWYISFRFVTSCQFLTIISKHQIELSKPQKVLEMRGIDPRTSRIQSERSTISATFPYSSSFELASERNSWNISCRFVTSCQFFPFVSQNKIELSKPQKCIEMRGIDPRIFRMRSERSTIWATSPYPLSFELASEQSPWYISFRFLTSCQLLPIFSKHQIELSKPQNCFGDAGHRSPYLSHAKHALYHFSYVPYSSSFELASERNSWNISCRFVTSCQFFTFVSQNKIELSKPQ